MKKNARLKLSNLQNKKIQFQEIEKIKGGKIVCVCSCIESGSHRTVEGYSVGASVS